MTLCLIAKQRRWSNKAEDSTDFAWFKALKIVGVRKFFEYNKKLALENFLNTIKNWR
jgi:hypothetical protein